MNWCNTSCGWSTLRWPCCLFSVFSSLLRGDKFCFAACAPEPSSVVSMRCRSECVPRPCIRRGSRGQKIPQIEVTFDMAPWQAAEGPYPSPRWLETSIEPCLLLTVAMVSMCWCRSPSPKVWLSKVVGLNLVATAAPLPGRNFDLSLVNSPFSSSGLIGSDLTYSINIYWTIVIGKRHQTRSELFGRCGSISWQPGEHPINDIKWPNSSPFSDVHLSIFWMVDIDP